MTPDVTHLPTSHTPGSFWHPGTAVRHLGIFGTRWAADRAAIVDTGEAAPDDRIEDAADVRLFLVSGKREPHEPKVIGDRVCIGLATIDAAYYWLVQERYLAATWHAEGELGPVVAMCGERAVAVIMPMRRAG